MPARSGVADRSDMQVNVWTVTLAALVTALATGLGALPLRRLANRLDVANGIASVLMLAASVSLVWQAWSRGVGRLGLGLVLGAAFIAVFRRLHPSKGVLIVAVMTAHSVAEGIGVGVSYGGGERLGILITVLIALHNVPEGLAIGSILVPRGATIAAAAWWSVFSSLPQPLLAPFSFLFVEQFRAALPSGLGFAAGAMICMVWSELLPDLRSVRAERHAAHSH
jgi:zinc transporter, ZIP family